MADKKAMTDLHSLLAETLSAEIKAAKEAGEMNASLLNVARAFLKDNGIEADATNPESSMGKLKDDFPFQGEYTMTPNGSPKGPH